MMILNQQPYNRVGIGNRFTNMELFWAYTVNNSNPINQSVPYFFQRNGTAFINDAFISGTQEYCIESDVVAPRYSNDVVAITSFAKKKDTKILRAGLLEAQIQGLSVPIYSGAFIEIDDSQNVFFVVGENNTLIYYKKGIQDWCCSESVKNWFLERLYDRKHTILVHFDKLRRQFSLFLYHDDLILLDQTEPIDVPYNSFMRRQLGVTVAAADGDIWVDNMMMLVSPYKYHRITSIPISNTPLNIPAPATMYPLFGIGLRSSARQNMDILAYSVRQTGVLRRISVQVVKTPIHAAAPFSLMSYAAYQTNAYVFTHGASAPFITYSAVDMLQDCRVLFNNTVDFVSFSGVLRNVVGSSAMPGAEATDFMRYFAWLAVYLQDAPAGVNVLGTITFAEY